MVQGLRSILSDMKGIYNSVDVRVAAIRRDVDHEWQNFLTVIRYSHQTKEEIIKKHGMLGTKSKVNLSDKFMVRYKVLGVEDQLLARDGKNYIFQSNDAIIYYWDLIEPEKMEFYYTEYPEFYCDNWGAFQGITNERIDIDYTGDHKFIKNIGDYQKIVSDEKVDAMQLGFSDIRSAVVHFLEIRNAISSVEPRIWLTLPIFATIDKPYYSNGSVCVNVRRHSKLPRLQVNYLRAPFHQGYNVDLTKAVPRTFELKSEEGDSKIIEESIKLEDYEADVIEKIPDDEIFISLVYLGLGGITINSETPRKVKDLLATSLPQMANPLHASVRIFCSEDDFKKMLLEPQGFRSIGKEGKLKLSIQTVFERAVAWLLELGGYRSVWLGEKEIWQEVSGFQHGSADILAFNPVSKCLYVIGCSLKPPEHDEILDMARTGEKIDVKLFGSSTDGIEVIPVYFYASKQDKEITTLASRNHVVAIPIEGIEQLYEELKTKQAISDLRIFEKIIQRGEAL